MKTTRRIDAHWLAEHEDDLALTGGRWVSRGAVKVWEAA